MKLEFCSLSSGSSGNCYYLGNEFHGILIDAGISAGSIRKFLKAKGVSVTTIMGVLVTHNHVDHVKGLEVLTRKNHVPVFTTDTVWETLFKPPYQQNISGDCVRKIEAFRKFHLAGFDIEAFPVCHDAPETLGYHICYGSRKITIVTDLGHICETAAKYIKAANFLVIESNYDEKMLREGNYPYFLKERISGKNGHLDNLQTSTFLAEHIHRDVSHICLAHLSKNNNTPEKALQTLNNVFRENGRILNDKPSIHVLERSIPSEIITITADT